MPDSILASPQEVTHAPTPSLGGPLLSRHAGPRDNGTLEVRDDVLTFTGPPLTEPVDVLGPVSARLSISTDTGHADVFTRLCDVDAQGCSVNVCDGAGRLRPAGQEPSHVTVPMSSTAHRIRWQISAGAHPCYARNPGTGESPVDATTFVTFVPVRITLHADSVLRLKLMLRTGLRDPPPSPRRSVRPPSSPPPAPPR